MKNNITLLLMLCLSVYIQAQVGINTKEPKGVFHIDASGNNNNASNPTAAQLSDDVVILRSGEVGIGTIPTHKLHIKSAPGKGLRLETPGAEDGAVLTAGPDGLAYWDLLSFGNTATSWKISHAGFLFDGTPQKMEVVFMADVFFENTVDDASATTSMVTLPPGNYMLFFSGAIETADDENVYATSRIKGFYTGEAERYLNETYYAEHTFSFADFYKFDKEVNLSLEIQLLENLNNIDTNYTKAVVPPRTFPYEFTLTAIKLPF